MTQVLFPRKDCLKILVLAAVSISGGSSTLAAEKSRPLTVVVMDPLAAPLACACVQGHAQRNYDQLAAMLEKRLARKVVVHFSESLRKVQEEPQHDPIDLVIGKRSTVLADAAAGKLPVRPLAMLTDKEGHTTLRGLFVVPKNDRARKLGDLAGYRVLLGTPDADEKHKAAIKTLKAAGVSVPEPQETFEGCGDAALAVLENRGPQGAVAVISSYAMALLEGCGTIPRDTLRVLGATEPVAFIAVFATDRVTAPAAREILAALQTVRESPELLKALETKNGFVPVESPSGWLQWRGPRRDGLVDQLPERLPAKPEFLWRKRLTGHGFSGLVATEREVIVADRSRADDKDVFRCLDAESGAQRWKLEYPAQGKMDYGAAPRATPLIDGDRVYLLGAFGDLHCVALDDGRILWKKHLIREFGAKLVTWGMCASPLLVDGRLIVNPGAKDASLVAIDAVSGEIVWKCPGKPAAYSSFLVGRFGGVRQIVGYDADSLGGWDVATGRRLWTVALAEKDEFIVPTPIDFGGRLLVVTKNNAALIFDFDDQGVARAKPTAVNEDLASESSTPVLIAGKIYGCHDKLLCLDPAAGLKKVWDAEDPAFDEYASLIGSPDRILVATIHGELLLVHAGKDRYELISRLRAFEETSRLVSHPALVGNRLYLRDDSTIGCLLLNSQGSP